MTTYVALLQGINIGSKKRIKMDALRALVADLGGGNVRTYVNSGNAVFTHEETDAAALEHRMEAALRDHVGMDVATIIRTGEEMQDVVARNPFPDAVADPKTLHVDFLRNEPEMDDVNVAVEMETGDDSIAILGREVYLYLPNYMSGASIDLNAVAKVLRQDATSRNWNTVTKLAGMASDD